MAHDVAAEFIQRAETFVDAPDPVDFRNRVMGALERSTMMATTTAQMLSILRQEILMDRLTLLRTELQAMFDNGEISFEQYLEGLLERMHGSCEHRGRTPGVDPTEARRKREIEEAQVALEEAVAAEDFERAAELRDRLSALSADGGEPRAPEDGGAQLA